MKKILCTIVSLATLSGAYAQSLDRSIRPKPGPAPVIRLGKTESFTLANGLKVFVVENHKLPAITLSIQLDVKPALEGDAAGYQAIAGQLLTAGTTSRSKDVLNAAVDNIGARISATPVSISANSLKRFQDDLLNLMSDMVIHSDFQQEELDRLKQQTASSLEAQRNNPDAMLANVTAVIDYGPQHPYGEITTDATLKNVKLERCRTYYNTYWRPNVAYMAIVGDVTLAEIKPLIQKYFSAWQRGQVPAASYKLAPANDKTTVALVNRNGAVQSVFNVSYPIALRPGTPDVVKAKVANAVLGGGSQGRLFLNLREAHGWTYGSYSNIREDELMGNFTGYAKCRNAVTDSSLTEMLREMQRMTAELVPQQELRNRITYLSGNFAIGLENPQTVAQYAINIERYKMPKDYYTNYLKSLSAVTAADVQAIARQYIRPGNANVILVGNAAELPASITTTAVRYDNYGRKTGATGLSAPPAGMKAGEVEQKYIAAIGGEEVLKKIRDIKVVRTVSGMGDGQMTMTEIRKSPGSFLRMVENGGQILNKTVYTGDKGFTELGGKKTDLTGIELEGAREQADVQTRLHPQQYGITRTLKGLDKVDEKPVYVLEKTLKGGRSSLEYYDTQTGLLVKESSVRQTPNGEMEQSIEYSDYREVPGSGGYRIAYTIKQTTNTQHLTIGVQSASVNSGVSESVFK